MFCGGVVYFYIIVIIMESRLLSMKSGLQKRKREHLVIFLTISRIFFNKSPIKYQLSTNSERIYHISIIIITYISI